VRSPGPSGRDRPRGATRVLNLSRASPAARLSASLLPYEIVRKKPVQMMKFDGIVVARRMQHHAVRRRACLFVADIGVAHETRMVIDGSMEATFCLKRRPKTMASKPSSQARPHRTRRKSSFAARCYLSVASTGERPMRQEKDACGARPKAAPWPMSCRLFAAHGCQVSGTNLALPLIAITASRSIAAQILERDCDNAMRAQLTSLHLKILRPNRARTFHRKLEPVSGSVEDDRCGVD
jgi:hypothetical protein